MNEEQTPIPISEMDEDYFIKKFSAIPEDQWCTEVYHSKDGTQHCAMGHCGYNYRYTIQPKEVTALKNIAKDFVIYNVNDGFDTRFQQDTPKQRIIAALEYQKEQRNKDKTS